jgi:hypothetical protein
MPYIIKNGKRIFRPYNIFLCKSCTDNGKYPHGKPFDIASDTDAVDLGKEWMCGECVRERVTEQKTVRGLYEMNR